MSGASGNPTSRGRSERSSRGRSSRGNPSPSQRSSQRSSPRPSPLASQHSSQPPSPERPASGHLDVPIGSDISHNANLIPVNSHFTPHKQVVRIPPSFDLPKSRRHIGNVLGESRSVNAESIIITAGKIQVCPQTTYAL